MTTTGQGEVREHPPKASYSLLSHQRDGTQILSKLSTCHQMLESGWPHPGTSKNEPQCFFFPRQTQMTFLSDRCYDMEGQEAMGTQRPGI